MLTLLSPLLTLVAPIAYDIVRVEILSTKGDVVMDIKECTGAETRTTGELLPRCCLCGEVPERGIRGGIKIRKAFICEQCERQIVVLQIGTNSCQSLIEELKKIW